VKSVPAPANSIVCGALVAVVVTACGGSSSGPKAVTGAGPVQHPASLVGIVGHNDAFAISLTDPDGQAISHLAAGTYSLAVKDESGIHNFHLTGDGVDKASAVGSKGTSSFTVTFKPGTYTFVCDPHASSMHGQFTVT
jgi:hypothetical protein